MTDKADGKRPGGCLLSMLWIAVGALVGLVIGYLVGVLLACFVLMPNSNLCGFVGVFITGPLGFLVGAAYAAWRTMDD
ncbi:MAG TPA: hypothetical protein VEI07_19665 [Planctomycetaceae bacterium]|nr:hypothetical protein [Planctomycetaceae bacterium]